MNGRASFTDGSPGALRLCVTFVPDVNTSIGSHEHSPSELIMSERLAHSNAAHKTDGMAYL